MKAESIIADTLNQKENIIKNKKSGKRAVNEAVPLLVQVVTEGIKQGLFACKYIEKRVVPLFVMSIHLFDGDSVPAEMSSQDLSGEISNTSGVTKFVSNNALFASAAMHEFQGS